MNRYYLPVGAWQEGTLELTGDEAKHCARVMRAQVGDRVEIFDGAGKSAVCDIESVARELVSCRITEIQTQPQPAHPVTLCQSIPKGSNMELIVQKAVELGVSAIQPLITSHTVARPESAEKKRAKWQRIALEACKQSGQNHLPEVYEPILFTQWIGQKDRSGTRLIAALDEKAVHLKSLFSATPPEQDIAYLVGPEGDFSQDEYQLAYEAGFQPISFGSIIMRVETATLYGLSIIQHELSSLE